MHVLLELVKEKGDLPALPEIVAHIDNKLRDPNSTLQQIARLIETDPVLAGRIINLSNSAFYSAGRLAVTDLKMAIGRLGLDEIRNTVYSLTLLKMFQNNQLFDQKMFWRHSLSVAFCSQSLSRILGAGDIEKDIAYTAGLMHDIGVLVFAYLESEGYERFLAELGESEQKRPLHIMERETFFIDHAQLGSAYIKQWWPVDEMVILAVKEHHIASSGGKFVSLIGRIVSTANEYCNGKGITNGLVTPPDELDSGYFDLLELNQEQVEMFLEEGEEIIELADAILSY